MGKQRTPEQIHHDARVEMRCLAKCKRKAEPCQNTATWPTKKGKGKRRCRMHGGEPGKSIPKTAAGRAKSLLNLTKSPRRLKAAQGKDALNAPAHTKQQASEDGG